jgi:hypothetical protein
VKTIFLLMAQHDGRAVIRLADVAREHFGITEHVLLRKVRGGEIKLPILEMEDSQKGLKGVHVSDLAAYIEARQRIAQKIAS